MESKFNQVTLVVVFFYLQGLNNLKSDCYINFVPKNLKDFFLQISRMNKDAENAEGERDLAAAIAGGSRRKIAINFSKCTDIFNLR